MSDTSTFAVQTPLNLVLPIKPGEADHLKAVLTGVNQGENSPLRTALQRLGNVHFAQFVFMEKDSRLGVFTIYDGDFDDYILSFVEHIGEIFNVILRHIDDGGSDLIPVQQHRDRFLKFIRAHDLDGLGQFSAYPGRRAFDILDAVES